MKMYEKKAVTGGSVQSEIPPLELVPELASRASFTGLGYPAQGWTWQMDEVLLERCMALRASVKAAVEE